MPQADFNPLSPAVRSELAAMSNRLVEIEDALVRVMQHSIAQRLTFARENLFIAMHEMKGEEDRWATPL